MSRLAPVDLHTHSTVSDGTLSPGEVVKLATAKGLSAVALTDHDHVGGLAEAARVAAEAALEFVPGIELSVESPWGNFHLLGYYFDPNNLALEGTLADLRIARDERNRRILATLNDLGAPVTEEEVRREAGNRAGKSVGRPHIASVLVKKGVVGSIQEAFDRFLAEGRPAHVDKRRLAAGEAIGLIRDAGGLPVIAHPVTLPDETRETALRSLAGEGLAGVEVWHPRHDGKLRERLARLAEELDLVATGGSDFHGANKPDVSLGTGTGDLRIPYSVVEALKARL